VPTLADVIDRIDGTLELPRQRQADLRAAVRFVCRAVGRQPAHVVADPDKLRAVIATMTPPTTGASPQRLRNARSLFWKALRLANVTTLPRRSRQPTSKEWRSLMEQVADRYERAKLSKFAAFCTNAEIEPLQVDDGTMAAFREAVARSPTPRPKQVVRDVALAWNRCAASVPGCPQNHLSVPNNRRTYARPIEDFPQAFQDDVRGYLEFLLKGDLFSERHREPMSPTTIRDRGLQILQLSTVLVEAGRPIESIALLSDLVDVQSAKTILVRQWERNGQRKTGQLFNYARLLVHIAKNWAKVPEDHLDRLRAMRKQIDPGKGGLTEKNKARLRQFVDPVNCNALVSLSGRIADRLGRLAKPSYNDAVAMQTAVAIALELVCPLRAENLAGLTRDRHIVRVRPGPESAVHIVIPADEVKNRQTLEFPVPPYVVRLIDLYCKRFRPLLAKGPTQCLFPARNGGPKQPGPLGAQIKAAIFKEIGLTMHVHLFRHFCAFIYLKANPGDYETIRILLGHKTLTTTARFYCGLEHDDAFRRFDALLERSRQTGIRRNAA
jgi:integrase